MTMPETVHPTASAGTNGETGDGSAGQAQQKAQEVASQAQDKAREAAGQARGRVQRRRRGLKDSTQQQAEEAHATMGSTA